MDILGNIGNEDPGKGKLLISEPFLYDPNFRRTVILLCEHNDEGSIGFILNRKLEVMLNEVLEDVSSILEIPLFLGGPVQNNTLHFVHHIDALKETSQQVMDNMWWGGDFDIVKEMIRNNTLELDKIRFFLGYSGWGKNQLENEIEEKSWIVTGSNEEIVFQKDNDMMWKSILKKMGGAYKLLSNSPESPYLN